MPAPYTRHASRIARRAAIALAIAAPAAGAQTRTLTSGIDTTGFDKSARPQDDFFRYVNGAWLKKTTIAGDATGAGSFQELTDRILEVQVESEERLAKSGQRPLYARAILTLFEMPDVF